MEKSCDADRVRNEMRRSLAEWGVRPEKNDTHKRFYHRAIKTALSYCEGNNKNKNKNSNATNENNKRMTSPLRQKLIKLKEGNDFPRDPEAAVKFVLRQEIEDDGIVFTRVEDRLDLPFAPFYVTNQLQTGRALPQFARYRASDLDPFARFSFRGDVGIKECVRDDWEDADGLGGHVFEALVASHVVRSGGGDIACKACYARNGLRYNGGIDASSSWADVVCIRCHATYEIKSKRDAGAVEKGFCYGFPGGSFRSFVAYEQLGKRFLLVVSRKPSIDGGGNRHHPVICAEIDHVTPRLSSDSFDPDGERIKLVTTIKPVNRFVWFHMQSPSTVHWQSIAKEVFDARFGAGEWARMGPDSDDSSAQAGGGDDVQHPPAMPTEAATAESKLEAIQCALNELHVGDDEEQDWENLYSSD